MRWFRALVHRRRRYDDLSISIQEHLAERIEELVDGGVPLRDAEHTARREFGNIALTQERSREVWQWPMIESAWADAKYACRQLAHAPAFTLTAVVTLALGIAVNATIFSLVDAFLVPHLPSPSAASLVMVSSVNPDRSFLPDTDPISAPSFFSLRADTRLFADLSAADEHRTGSLAGDGQPEAVSFAAVTPNYFSLLGASAQLGRTFVDGEDLEGRNHVIVLSHGLWQRRYGSDSAVIGRVVRLDRENYTIIGIMSADFRLLGFAQELWTPLVLTSADHAPVARSNRNLYAYARLAPGLTLEQARTRIDAFAERAQHEYPSTEQRWKLAVRTLPDFLVYNFAIRSAMAILMTVVTMVLLIACANVAGLLLTRAVGRQNELGIRLSLGASRMRVVRQLLTEGLVIGLFGGALGILLTWAGIRLVRAGMAFNDAVRAVPIRLDTNVLLFALAVSLASALLASMAPALKASRSSIGADLSSENRTTSGSRSQGRLRAILVAGEIAMAFVLLIGSGLLIHGVYVLEHQSLGFRHDHLLTAGLTLDQARYQEETRRQQFVRALLPALHQLPGVENAAVASDLPAAGSGRVSIHIRGQAEPPANAPHSALDVVVTPEYFQAAGVSLVRGRLLAQTDHAGAPRVILVNQEFVHRFLADRDPLGLQIQLDLNGEPAWTSIVGMVSDVKTFSEDTRIDPQIYESFAQRPIASMSLMLRTSVDPNSLIPQLRAAIAALDPDLPLLRTMSMDGVLDVQKRGNTVFTRMLATFALLALTLACVGIYGLISYSVGQRTHEIGIRVALGADTSHIARMVVKQGMKIAALGSAAGLALALPLPRLFDSIFMGILFSSPAVYPTVFIAVSLVAILATVGPARRAARVNPATALRNE
jgi:predicted permease